MKKDLIIAVLLTFCLTATLFMIASPRSQEYDPWEDVNEDGKIDILDIVALTNSYGALGGSTKNVNVTNWLEQPPKTIIVTDGELITFPMQEVLIDIVNVTGYRYVSIFIGYYIEDGTADVDGYSQCQGLRSNAAAHINLSQVGVWAYDSVKAFEAGAPMIDFTAETYGATILYLTLVLYCYN